MNVTILDIMLGNVDLNSEFTIIGLSSGTDTNDTEATRRAARIAEKNHGAPEGIIASIIIAEALYR